MSLPQFFRSNRLLVFLLWLLTLTAWEQEKAWTAPKTLVSPKESFEDKKKRFGDLLSRRIRDNCDYDEFKESIITHLASIDEWLEEEKPSKRIKGSTHLKGLDSTILNILRKAKDTQIPNEELIEWHKKLAKVSNYGFGPVLEVILHLATYGVTLADFDSAVSAVEGVSYQDHHRKKQKTNTEGCTVQYPSKLGLVFGEMRVENVKPFLALYDAMGRDVNKICEWMKVIKGRLSGDNFQQCQNLYSAFSGKLEQLKVWSNIFNQDENLPLSLLTRLGKIQGQREESDEQSPQGRGWSANAFRRFREYFPEGQDGTEAVLAWWLDEATLQVDDSKYRDYVKNLCVVRSCRAVKLTVQYGLDVS